MTEEELERCENKIPTSVTMEAIREIQGRGELDKRGKLIKENSKGAIHRKKQRKQKSRELRRRKEEREKDRRRYTRKAIVRPIRIRTDPKRTNNGTISRRIHEK